MHKLYLYGKLNIMINTLIKIKKKKQDSFHVYLLLFIMIIELHHLRLVIKH